MKRLAFCLSACLLVLGAAPAQAAILNFSTTLSGANEVTPNMSPATGAATVTVDDVANTMRVVIDWSGLQGDSTAGHIHCCTATPFTGSASPATVVPSFPGLSLGVRSGHYDHTFNLLDTATYNGAFVTANGGTAAGAEAAFIAGLGAGTSYLNIHSRAFTGGEIRGFLARVPEPGSIALFGLGFAGLALMRRRRNASA